MLNNMTVLAGRYNIEAMFCIVSVMMVILCRIIVAVMAFKGAGGWEVSFRYSVSYGFSGIDLASASLFVVLVCLAVKFLPSLCFHKPISFGPPFIASVISSRGTATSPSASFKGFLSSLSLNISIMAFFRTWFTPALIATWSTIPAIKFRQWLFDLTHTTYFSIHNRILYRNRGIIKFGGAA